VWEAFVGGCFSLSKASSFSSASDEKTERMPAVESRWSREAAAFTRVGKVATASERVKKRGERSRSERSRSRKKGKQAGALKPPPFLHFQSPEERGEFAACFAALGGMMTAFQIIHGMSGIHLLQVLAIWLKVAAVGKGYDPHRLMETLKIVGEPTATWVPPGGRGEPQ